MLIRPFAPADTEPVVALWERCGVTRPWNDPRRDIDRKLTVQPDLFLVGVRDEAVVASVMAGYDGHRGWVNYLAVDPDHRHLSPVVTTTNNGSQTAPTVAVDPVAFPRVAYLLGSSPGRGDWDAIRAPQVAPLQISGETLDGAVASADFRIARLLGVRSGLVIAVTFAISGLIAAAVAFVLTVQSGTVGPSFGVQPTLFGLIGAVIGGLRNLRGAVVGGFVVGVALSLLTSWLPPEINPFRTAFVYLLVIAVLVLRPNGLFSAGAGKVRT
jgi:hypothetical protein